MNCKTHTDLTAVSSQAPFNTVTLQVIGDDSAPIYFTLGNDNIIRVSNTSSLNSDTATFYRVRYDSVADTTDHNNEIYFKTARLAHTLNGHLLNTSHVPFIALIAF